jgi:hypothetical protein
MSARFHDAAVIPHDAEPRVLLLPTSAGWELPTWEQTERHFWQDVGPVNRAVRQRLGLTVRTLRCLAVDDAPNGDGVVVAYLLENLDPSWAPPAGGRWFAPAAAERERLTASARLVLDRWVAYAGQPPSTLRPPWIVPGWFAAAQTWIAHQLARLGLRPTGPVEQHRTWERSTVLRVPISGGDLYFKAVPPMFAHEPRLAAAMAAWFPASAPAVLAVDPERGWMLTRDLGGVPLARLPDILRWEEALAAWAGLQVALARAPDRLRGVGLPERPLGGLIDQIDAIFADEAALLLGLDGGLSAEEAAALRAQAPRLKRACVDLAALPIPSSLEHGDFSPAQVVATDRGCLFFDWSDSSVAHPFFSLVTFLDDAAEALPDQPGLGERLRNAYLAPWAVLAPPDRLREAFDLALLLAPLHHALIYHCHVLPGMEQRWEMERMLPFYLKLLLRRAA